MSEHDGATYAAAGVDIDAGERAVELMKPWIAKTIRPEVVGGIGGFAGLFELDLTRWRRPLLASSTDGVGTKLAIAKAMGKHDTVGQDLVAMVADDVVVCGAEPLFLQDYIACGKVVPERLAEIVSGIAEGCRLAGCSLVGGETAEHPGMLAPDEYDIAGTAVGAVEADAVLGPDRVRPGDALVALASSGLHSNGYSLVRHVLGETSLDSEFDGGTLGEALLTPTRIYSRDCLALLEQVEVHAFAHVTGGGLAENLVRVLPDQMTAVVDRSTWQPQPLFDYLGERGRIAAAELERTFNLGIGMIAIVPAEQADAAVRLLSGREVPSWVAGEISSAPGTAAQVRLESSHLR